MVSTSRDNPIQLWDSLTGLLRCTYRAYNHVVSASPAPQLRLEEFVGQSFTACMLLLD